MTHLVELMYRSICAPASVPTWEKGKLAVSIGASMALWSINTSPLAPESSATSIFIRRVILESVPMHTKIFPATLRLRSDPG